MFDSFRRAIYNVKGQAEFTYTPAFLAGVYHYCLYTWQRGGQINTQIMSTVSSVGSSNWCRPSDERRRWQDWEGTRGGSTGKASGRVAGCPSRVERLCTDVLNLISPATCCKKSCNEIKCYMELKQ